MQYNATEYGKYKKDRFDDLIQGAAMSDIDVYDIGNKYKKCPVDCDSDTKWFTYV